MDQNSNDLQQVVTQNTNSSAQTQVKVEKIRYSVFGIVLILFLVVAYFSYSFGVIQSQNANNSKVSTIPQRNNHLATSTPAALTNVPTRPKTDKLGTTMWSYSNINNEIAIKQTIILYDDNLRYGNEKKKIISNIYLHQDDAPDRPKEFTENEISKHEWKIMVEEPIKESSRSAEITVNDRLFSFRKVPGTEDILFVVDLVRNWSGSQENSSTQSQIERVIYLYSPDSESQLTKIQSFKEDNKGYTYPMISEFSEDGRYVSFNLYGCWNCGVHMPEKYIVDLKTLQSKNIGKTAYFSWKGNGAYDHKEAVLYECDDVPGVSICSKDVEELPLLSGQL